LNFEVTVCVSITCINIMYLISSNKLFQNTMPAIEAQSLCRLIHAVHVFAFAVSDLVIQTC